MQLASAFIISRIFAEATSFPLQNAEYSMSRFTAIFVAMLIIGVFNIPLAIFAKLYPGENLISILLKKSKALAWIIALYIMLLLFMISSFALSKLEYYATSTALGDAPPLLLISVIAAISGYAIWKGAETTVRFATAVAFVFGAFLTVITLTLSKHFNTDFLYPVLVEDGGLFVQQVVNELAKDTEYVAFGILMIYVRQKAEFTGVGVIFIFIFTEIIVLIETLSFGSYLTKLNFPLFSAASLADIVMFQRLDGFDVVIWILACIVKVSIYGVCIKTVFLQLLGDKACKISIWVFIALAAAFALILSLSLPLIKTVANPILVISCTFFGGTLIPLMILILNRKKRKADAAAGQASA